MIVEAIDSDATVLAAMEELVVIGVQDGGDGVEHHVGGVCFFCGGRRHIGFDCGNYFDRGSVGAGEVGGEWCPIWRRRR